MNKDVICDKSNKGWRNSCPGTAFQYDIEVMLLLTQTTLL